MSKKTSRINEQVNKFKQAARELGCDEDEERFDAALRKIGKAKPSTDDGAVKEKPKGKTMEPSR